MKSKDLEALYDAKILVVGEDSNLFWSDEVSEYAMFADYYFKKMPEDHGERSRNVESRNLFDHINFLTKNKLRSKEIYITNLCNEYVTPPPRGKRVLIPEEKAKDGLKRIEKILKDNPTIQYVFIMSLQSNYWLQKLGFYTSDEEFLHNAQPKRVGLVEFECYYQPVNAKAFQSIIGNIYKANKFDVNVVPILPAKDYPLKDKNEERFSESYQKIKANIKFNTLEKKEE